MNQSMIQPLKYNFINSMRSSKQSHWFLVLMIVVGGVSAEVATADSFKLATSAGAIPVTSDNAANDRLWLINTRGITSNASCADLQSPMFSVFRLNECGQTTSSSIDDYLGAVSQSPAVVLYAHGNRMKSNDAIRRGMTVHRRTRICRAETPIDWVIWSWPSEQQGILAKDARIKANRTDAQGLYMAWLLRRHAEMGVPTAMIGYSFGGRVVTGALHAAAGGSLAGRSLQGPGVMGMRINAGLVAPALENNWMQRCGYHSESTKNLNQLVLLYNRKDVVLKRYWLLDRVRGESALGYSGPTSFADRIDGTRLPVVSKDCAPTVGLQHSELDYYTKSCRAGQKMSTLIDDLLLH